MKDSDGNEIRYYDVVYTRLVAGKKRMRFNVRVCENDLKSILYDFKSRFAYIVESAQLVNPEEDEKEN